VEEVEVLWNSGRNNVIPLLLLTDRIDIVEVYEVLDLLPKSVHIDIPYGDYIMNRLLIEYSCFIELDKELLLSLCEPIREYIPPSFDPLVLR
jgi:hypothetical protein